jgi:endonuclease/exonuclease/phosphatase family metal-dependent hydrolase
MDNLNNIPNVGNWGDAASRLNDNFNKIKQAVTTVENTSKNNKGYFSSLSALNTAFPSPKDGQTAYVYDEASSTQYYIYNAVDGAWVATTVEAPSVGVDLEGYTKTGGSTKTTKEVENDLAQLAGDVEQNSYVKITNLVTNGDFSNGTTGWGVVGSTIAVSNANLIITPGDTEVRPSAVSTAFSGVNSGDKIYICLRVRTLNSKLSHIRARMANSGLTFPYGDVEISSPVENQWYTVSGIISKEITYPSYVILLQAEYPTADDALNSQYEIDYVMAINLTETFGAGNEPTEEEMNLILGMLPVDYFEGEYVVPQEIIFKRLVELNVENNRGIAFQTDEFSPIGATIADATNTWFVNSGIWVGALVSVADYKGHLIDIHGNENMESTYTFLKNGNIVDGQRPDFSDEYSGTIKIPKNQIARIHIPLDAEYLYVYIRSYSTYYVPKYVRIYYHIAQFNSIDKQRLLYEKKTDSINDLLEFTPVLLDTSNMVQGSTMNVDGTDADTVLDTSRTDYIHLSGINTLRILGNKQLADGYVLWFKYTWYQSDYSFVSVSAWTPDASIEVPSNAMGGYVRIAIQRKNGSTILSYTSPAHITPYKLSVCNTINKITEITETTDSIFKGLAPKEIIVCTYNIGHFSLGASQNSTISSANYLSKLNLFRTLIYDTINPKIIGLQEYSKVFGFGTDGVPKQAIDVLFDDLSVFYEGVQRRYSCNALYSNTYLKNIQINEFECNQDADVTHTTAIEATDYYYLSADLYMEGRLVKFVSTHLVFDNNRPSVLQLAQINELVSKYAGHNRVLMIGDWNVYAQSDFDPFVAAGYTLANDGTIITYPGGSKALDNIVVKGLTITNVQAVASDLSDHYPLLATISL